MDCLVVLSEPFAMVRGHDEEGVLSQAEALQGPVEPPDQLVGPRHFAVVRASGVPGGIRLRRLVRIVGIVEVDPGEYAAVVLGLEPRHRLPHRLVAALLDRVQEAGIVRAGVEMVGVGVEAALEARLGRDHDGRHEPRCGSPRP